MPEGDTIWRAAARLRPALEGAELVRFEAPRLAGSRPRVGETIDAVRAVGKHLLIDFSGGLTLDTHLRMTGTWRLVRAGDRWPKPPHLLRVRVDVDGWQALCFAAPVVRTFPTAADRVDSPVGHLGPDLCEPDPDLARCVALIGELSAPDRTVAEVLLDQRCCNGVGNVYKSEVCWALRIHPDTPIERIDEAGRMALVATASRLLAANLTPGRARRTVAGGLAVYGLRGRPCRRCGTAIRSRGDGPDHRISSWCPTCQPAPGP